MRNLINIGRIFYGITIAGIGIQAIYYNAFPYMLFPPMNFQGGSLIVLIYVSGAILILAGASIVFEKKTKTGSLLLASILLLIVCFCYIPFEFMTKSNYLHWEEWENAEKELALSGGAFIIAGCYSEKNENTLISFLKRLIPLGAIFFSVTMISFGINHFLYTKDVSEYIPSWVPNPIFWTYLAGIALIGSGIAILLRIKPGLIAALLGAMIFIWFIILHIPKVIASPFADKGGEITSAFLALAYSGIAFVIAGVQKSESKKNL